MGLFTAAVKLGVSGMSCAHCENAVESGVGGLSGVKSVKADFKKSTVIVKGGDIEEVKAKIAELGYEVI